MLFTFAGSSHSKYATYLLETITTLELESSQVLRNSLLRMMVLNLSGTPGGCAPGDLIQEYFNRLLEAIVERKGKEFDDVFIREVIVRNLHRMAKLKPDLREGVSLSKRSTRHSEPHTNPEVWVLLQQYAHHQLHSRRAGRFVEEKDVDDFTSGWKKLGKGKGKLTKWINETTHARVRVDIDNHITALGTLTPITSSTSTPTTTLSDGNESASDDGDESGTDSEDDDPNFRNSIGAMGVVDGHFLAHTLDMDQTMEQAAALLEAELVETEELDDEISDDESDSDKV